MLHDNALELVGKRACKGAAIVTRHGHEEARKKRVDVVAACNGKHECARVRSLHEQRKFFHRFEMVKEYHVGAGADGKFDASGTGAHMQAHFALCNGAVRILEQSFNRLFDRLDEHLAIRSNALGKGGHRRGAAARRRPCYEHKSAIERCKLHAEFGQVKVLKRDRLHRNNADGNARRNIVPRHGNAGAANTREAHRFTEIATNHNPVTIRKAFGSFGQAVHQVRLFEHLFGCDKKHTRLAHGNLAVGVKVDIRDIELAGIGDNFCKRRKWVQDIGSFDGIAFAGGNGELCREFFGHRFFGGRFAFNRNLHTRHARSFEAFDLFDDDRRRRGFAVKAAVAFNLYGRFFSRLRSRRGRNSGSGRSGLCGNRRVHRG